ncbi:hypothetical protein WJX82_008709 [Trebouxia sp. C0006]
MAPLSKVAVVIGVGPGIGAASAKKFASKGYAVALLSRSIDKLTPVESEISKAGGKALSLPTDVGKPAEVIAAFDKIKEQLGHPEVLIYNAGPGGVTFPPPSALDLKPEVFEGAFSSGVVGALTASQQVLPGFIENQHGTIVFTGATAALRGGAKFSLLSAPKFALRSLAQSLAREFQPQKIHVVHVNIDGVVDLPRTRASRQDKPDDFFLKPAAIADTYWALHEQDPSAWTHELDVRPAGEKW